MIRQISLLISPLIFAGCALFPAKKTEDRDGPKSKIFYASYEQIWRASQLALANYPMRINNMDTGLLETDVIGGLDAWTPPGQRKRRISSSQHYIIRMKVIKGKSRRTKAAKVIVEKRIRRKASFFSDSQNIGSDGLEEEIILYRTNRILKIEKAIEAAMADSNENEDDAGEDEESDEYGEDEY